MVARGVSKLKGILFCHAYREHLTGQSRISQENHMSTFLSQWERAIGFGGSSEPNETHIWVNFSRTGFLGLERLKSGRAPGLLQTTKLTYQTFFWHL